MSDVTSNARGGEFATAHRPRAADHHEFILAQRRKGVPVSAIARMIACNVADVAPIAALEASPRRSAPESKPKVGKAPPPRKAAVPPTARPIVEAHAVQHGLSVSAFCSGIWPRRLAASRGACWAEVYALGKFSLPQIASWFGRDHTTILAGINKHKQAVELSTLSAAEDLAAWNNLGRRAAA